MGAVGSRAKSCQTINKGEKTNELYVQRMAEASGQPKKGNRLEGLASQGEENEEKGDSKVSMEEPVN